MYSVSLHPPVFFSSLSSSFLFVITRSYPAQFEQMVSLFMHTFAKGPPSLLVPFLHLPRSLARSYLRSIYPSFCRILLSLPPSLPLTPSYPLFVEIFMLDVSRVCFAVILVDPFWRVRFYDGRWFCMYGGRDGKQPAVQRSRLLLT